MGEDGEDVKPKLNIVVDFEGQSCTILVKHNTPFKKIFDAAEKRFGKEPGTFKFTYEGKRIQATETPLDHEMQDGEVIDAHLQQLGGSL
ncbi:unnamed protein product [Somion occarium]|uniref:Ubiquitin-like domain-containing protein n=1 Tax=Somion occarium TaxID=3059160 RepID=A0ABP1D5W3_9APHY